MTNKTFMFFEDAPRVLCIEDEIAIRQSIADYLLDMDCTVYEAENGEVGLEKVRELEPDLVLLDLRMSGMFGIDVLTTIKKEYPDLPVIIVSGTGEVNDVIEALRAGALDFITKPIENLEVLGHAVKKSVERAGLIRKTQEYENNLEKLILQKTEALQKSEEKYRSIFENLQDIYFEVTMNGAISEISPSVAQISKYRREELLGRSIWALYADPSQREMLLKELEEKKKVVDYEVKLRDKDGRVVPGSISARLHVSPGRPGKIRGTLRDITYRKEVEEELESYRLDLEKRVEERTAELEKAKIQAEAATKAKSQFLANMSHEIRTPLNGVVSMVNLMMYTNLTSEQQEYARLVKRSADGLLSIINDILDFSKIEAGKLETETIDFNLRVSLEDIGEPLALKAQEKGLEYVCIVSPDVPALVRGDPGLMRQVLVNLVSNAVKFTAEGEVILTVTPVNEDLPAAGEPGEVTVEFSITDTGTGIPPDRLESLFAPFTQADASTTRKYGGSGLGLSISKQLVEIMGGRIDASSTPGKGSTFRFTIPLELQESQPPRQETIKNIKGERIIIIDDNNTNRRMLTALLESWECRCDDAPDAQSALEKMHAAVKANDPFRLAIIDLHMPGMDGEALGTKLKQDPALQHTLLVMMTSMGQRGDAKRLERIGFSAYLTKPVRHSVLYESLVTALRGKSPTAPETKRPIITRHSIKDARRRNTRILLADDNMVNRKAARIILEKYGFTVDTVEDGEDAVQAMKSAGYDLILMDCQMKRMDGYEATRIIKQSSPVPIIALTAQVHQQARDMCFEAGMDDFIAKPYDPKQMVDKIDSLVFKQERSDAIPVDKKGEVLFDKTWLLNRYMGDEDLVKEVVKAFLEETPVFVESLGKSLASGNAPGVQRSAHAIKGTIGDIGSEPLRLTAYEIETAGAGQDLQRAALLLTKLEEKLVLLYKQLEQMIAP